MSMFLCQRCDEMKDSDDGCEEGKNFGLICVDCINDLEDDANRGPADASYGEIYRTLTEAGCPDDLARELAREKSR